MLNKIASDEEGMDCIIVSNDNVIKFFLRSK